MLEDVNSWVRKWLIQFATMWVWYEFFAEWAFSGRSHWSKRHRRRPGWSSFIWKKIRSQSISHWLSLAKPLLGSNWLLAVVTNSSRKVSDTFFFSDFIVYFVVHHLFFCKYIYIYFFFKFVFFFYWFFFFIDLNKENEKARLHSGSVFGPLIRLIRWLTVLHCCGSVSSQLKRAFTPSCSRLPPSRWHSALRKAAWCSCEWVGSFQTNQFFWVIAFFLCFSPE